MAKIMAGEGTCKDVLKCLFSLGDFEMTVYKGLCKFGPARADQLSPFLKRDKSTVYRALQKLVTSGLVVKQTETLKRGGHFHVYSAVPAEKINERVKTCIDEWFNHVQEALQKFDIP
ncbi:MAG: TrmB family transcriptional regulator [Thermoplasmata archaeon]|nr:TrmB family transcriptional regulator [Thermoplasmata archaeon]